MFARIVRRSLKAMITKKENTVIMNATLKIDLKNRKENSPMYDKRAI